MLIKKLYSDTMFDLLVNIIMTIVAVIMLYPLIYVVSASLSSADAVTRGEVFLIPVDFTLDGYKFVFQNKDLWIGYRNTIFYTVFGTLMNLVVTLPAAYVMSRKDFRTKNMFMVFFMITMYISGGIVPTYMNWRKLGLLNTPLIMILNGALSVYNMIIARTFFASSIPGEISEAARVDGCSDFGIFFKIILPLSKPIIMVMTLYYGVGHWNEYFSAMIYLEDRNLFPLQVFLREILIQGELLKSLAQDPSISAESMQFLAQQAKAMELIKYCVIVVAALPMLMIYPYLQKYFEKGVMIGSVKG